MTDISGNFGVNSHSYDKANSKKEASIKPEVSLDKKEDNAPIDLDKSPAALNGKAMVKTNAAKAKEGEYQFDPKNVEDDIKEFQALYVVKEVMDEYKKDLIEKGYDPVAADEKAFMFANCLLANQNV